MDTVATQRTLWRDLSLQLVEGDLDREGSINTCSCRGDDGDDDDDDDDDDVFVAGRLFVGEREDSPDMARCLRVCTQSYRCQSTWHPASFTH